MPPRDAGSRGGGGQRGHRVHRDRDGHRRGALRWIPRRTQERSGCMYCKALMVVRPVYRATHLMSVTYSTRTVFIIYGLSCWIWIMGGFLLELLYYFCNMMPIAPSEGFFCLFSVELSYPHRVGC